MARPRKPADAALPPRPLPAAGASSEDWPDEALEAWMRTLLPRANAGDEAAARALMEACRETPRLWEMFSALSSHAEHSWIDLLMQPSGSTDLTRRALEEELKRKRSDVGGQSPSPLEALLVDRIVLCWIAATYADAQYARRIRQGMSFREGEYFARRCEQANRQLLKAIESLARVRRLLTPVQLNIGQNQINVAQQP